MIAVAPDWLLEFIETGGNILWVLLGVTIVLWTIILERLWFYNLVFPKHVRDWEAEWRARSDRSSWRARAIRELLVSRADVELRAGLPLLKMLIAVCPLLGLLGTVTGMLQVFDVVALKGTSDPRAMSAGISHATITTMAGLVIALSGVYFSTRFPQRAARETRRLGDRLDVHTEEAGS